MSDLTPMPESWRLKLTSRRVDPGLYVVNDRYRVRRVSGLGGLYERREPAWRWEDGEVSHGNEHGVWRDTKAQAMADLDEHLNGVNSQRYKALKSAGKF